jgi:import receptor subunit TOM70
VNKGLALYQWKQDITEAEKCCNEALEVDPECEAAVATLAQLNLQQSKIGDAVKMFSRQAELARSEPELVGALTFKYVSYSSLLSLLCLTFFSGDVVTDGILEELPIHGCAA